MARYEIPTASLRAVPRRQLRDMVAAFLRWLENPPPADLPDVFVWDPVEVPDRYTNVRDA